MDAIDLYTNKDKILTKYIDDFVENYKGDDIRPIKALADKIKHMCFNIGSPISVKPMLKSICKMQIKKWQAQDEYGDKKNIRGKQLHGSPQWYLDKYYQTKNGTHNIDIGHFRWDWGAYMISRDDADYIMQYFFQKERKGNIYLREITN